MITQERLQILMTPEHVWRAGNVDAVHGEGADGNQVTIPSIMISRADGDAIIAALRSETISASLILPPYIDGNYDNRVTYLGKDLRKGVLVRSWGPDGEPEVEGGKKDDLKSW